MISAYQKTKHSTRLSLVQIVVSFVVASLVTLLAHVKPTTFSQNFLENNIFNTPKNNVIASGVVFPVDPDASPQWIRFPHHFDTVVPVGTMVQVDYEDTETDDDTPSAMEESALSFIKSKTIGNDGPYNENFQEIIVEIPQDDETAEPIHHGKSEYDEGKVIHIDSQSRMLQTIPLLPLRINCGNITGDIIDPISGLTWTKDMYFRQGTSNVVGCSRAKTFGNITNVFSKDCVVRGGVAFSYAIPLLSSSYLVTLHFFETFFMEPNKRRFNVTLENVSVLKDFDIYVEASGAYKPMKRTFIATAVDGFLSIVANASLSGAIISGIEINELPPIRINAGSNASWTDPITSYIWEADQYFDTIGRRFSTRLCPLNITSTLQDTLYCTERNFPGTRGTNASYTIPALARGQYTVNLLFAELTFKTSNARVFDIYVQNNLIRSKFDIYTTAKNRSNDAVVISTLASITSELDLNIRLRFVNVIQNSKISAIEIIPLTVSKMPTSAPIIPSPIFVPTFAPIIAPASNSVISTIRINAGSRTPWTDPITNHVWTADRFFNASGQRFEFCPLVIQNTEQDVMYCSERYYLGDPGFNGTYVIPVLPGQYAVRLLFAENFFLEPKARIFHIVVQNQIIRSNFDIYETAGGHNVVTIVSAIANVLTSNRFIRINFVNVVQYAKISAIEIIPYTEAPTLSPLKVPTMKMPRSAPITRGPTFVPTFAPITTPAPTSALSTIRINAGSRTPWTDPITNQVWTADRFFNTAGQRFAFCPLVIVNTEQDDLYCSERYYFGDPGFNGTYIIPVLPGRYTVRLLFAENFFLEPKARVFHIVVQNRMIRSDFDIYETAGGQNVATTVSSIANVLSSNRFIRISFVNVVQYAKISAIEIKPYDRSVTEAPTLSPLKVPTMQPTLDIFKGYRINCGHNLPYADSLDRTWLPDQFFNGGTSISNTFSFANTVDDPLYNYERAGDVIMYNLTVPIATFQVNLFFAETIFTNQNQRLFDISIEDSMLESNVDLVRLAGGSKTAARLQFFQLVEDGVLNIVLSKSSLFPNASVPTISAIEVSLDKEHVSHAVANGFYFGTVTDEIQNTALIQLIGQTSHTHGEGLVLTEATWKEGNKTLGTDLNTNYNFPVGEHTISLTVKDSGQYTDTDIATVNIKPFGYPVITQLTPNNGNLSGNYFVTIRGSGFNYTADQITVFFGRKNVTGATNLTVVNSTTLVVRVPPSIVARSLNVVAQTPLDRSDNKTLASVFNYIDTIPILWTNGTLFSFSNPSVGRFGPDQRLYVGTRKGRLIRITLNEDFTRTISSLVSWVNIGQEAILGITFDPLDTKIFPDVYFTFNPFFHKGRLSSSGTTVGGKIRMASGPNLETITDVITGLPISDLDHGLNALEFGNNGELYITSGSHTNGGIPGPLSSSRQLKENFLSAAINVAYLSHPDFNGTIQWSAPDDGNMIAAGIDVYAFGLRNPFGLILHSNGNLYATDNGPNVGYGRMSTGCKAGQSIDDGKRDDKLLHVQKGQYYGHPNKNRATFFNDSRQCVWFPPEAKDTPNVFTAPLLTHPSSIDGMIEFHGNHFNGQLRSNLLFIRYNDFSNIYRVILTADGKAVLPDLEMTALPMQMGNLGLDITLAPNGNIIEMRYPRDTIQYYQPLEAPTTRTIIKTVFPPRGPNAGGNVLSIYGVNLNSTSSGPIRVLVGGINCLVITVISASRLDCKLPGGTGTVDITVGNGILASTFERGYRYISGLPLSNFSLPVYNGS